MTQKSTLAAIAMVALAGIASPTFDQFSKSIWMSGDDV
jgi:hypothetical protein